MKKYLGNAFYTGCLLVTLGVSGQLFAQAPDTAGTDDSTITYAAEYFAQFSPVTVSDMLDRIPGIEQILNANESEFLSGNSRGLGSSSSILVDGKRLAGKSNDSQSQLNRMAASEVAYIEIVRGTSSDLDVQNTGQLINIILNEAESRSTLSAEAGFLHYEDSTLEPELGLSFNGQNGKLNYLVSGSVRSGYNAIDSYELSLHPDLTTNEVVELERVREQTLYNFSSNLTYDLTDRDRLALNGLYAESDPPSSVLRSITDYNGVEPVTRYEREDIPSESYNWEVGGDYAHGFASGANFKALFIVNDKKGDTVRQRWEFAEPGAPQEKNLFLANTNRYREKIVRTSYTMNLVQGQGLELGVEAARTTQDTNLKLGLPFGGTSSLDYGGLVPVPIPNSRSTVEEIRYEGFAVHNWQLNPRMSLASSLVAEFSEIEQTGDVNNKRDFDFLKPKFDFRFDINSSFQMRGSIEKVVEQLSFADFAASTNEQDEDQDTRAGNPLLEQEESWRYVMSLDYRLPNDGGVLNSRLFYYDIDNDIGRIDISESPDDLRSTNGNVGQGDVFGLNLDASIRFGFIGLPQALLTASLLLQDSEIYDPLIAGKRKVVPYDRGRFRIGFRHDLPQQSLNYGFNYNDGIDGNRTFYDIDNVQYLGSRSNLTLFVEKAFAGLTYRLETINTLDHVSKQERRRFEGYLRDDVLEEIERFQTTNGMRIAFKIRGTF